MQIRMIGVLIIMKLKKTLLTQLHFYLALQTKLNIYNINLILKCNSIYKWFFSCLWIKWWHFRYSCGCNCLRMFSIPIFLVKESIDCKIGFLQIAHDNIVFKNLCKILLYLIKHILQKVCPHIVVTGSTSRSKHIWHSNSLLKDDFSIIL